MIEVNKFFKLCKKLRGKKDKQLKRKLFICLAFGRASKSNNDFPVSFAATIMKMNLCVCLNVCQGHGEWQTGFS